MSIGGAKQYFDETGIKYEEVFGQNEGQLDFVRRSLDLIGAGPSVSVLDIGQGTGKPTSALAAARGCRLHGIDISPVMAELARRQVPSGTFEAANMLEWEPGPERPPFDAAFAIFSLFQFTPAELRRMPARWSGWIRPGGHLFIGTCAADEYPPGVFEPSADDPAFGNVTRKFLGEPHTYLVGTKQGWEDLLASGGFRIVRADVVSFQPEQCDWEPDYFITCQKIE